MALSLQQIQKLAKPYKLQVIGNTGNYRVFKGKKVIATCRTLKEIKQYLENYNVSDIPVAGTASATNQSVQGTGRVEDTSNGSANSGTQSTQQRLPEDRKIICHSIDTINGCSECEQANIYTDATNQSVNQETKSLQLDLDCAVPHTNLQYQLLITETNNHENQQQQRESRVIEQIRAEIREHIEQQQQLQQQSNNTTATSNGFTQQDTKQVNLTLAQSVCTDDYVERVISEIEELLNHIQDGIDFDESRAFVAAGDILIPARINRYFKETSTKFYRFQDCDNYRLVAYVAFLDDEYQGVVFHDIRTGYYFDDEGCYQSLINYIIRLDINEIEHQEVTDTNWLALV